VPQHREHGVVAELRRAPKRRRGAARVVGEALQGHDGAARDAAAVAAMRARAASVALPDAMRAHFAAQLTDDAAAKLGKRVRPPALLHDVVDYLPPVFDAVLAGRVPGFGPAALRYTLDLAGELAAHWELRLRSAQERAEAASRKALSSGAVHACLTELARRTRDVLPADSPEREALDRAAKRDARSLDAGLEAVEETLGAVGRAFERAAKDESFAMFLDDAGFTQAAVGAIVAPVAPALAARRAHGDARVTSELTQQQIDRVEGRLRDQLLRLRARVEVARKSGAALPAVRAARVLPRPVRRKAPAASGPTPTEPRAGKARKARAKKAPVQAEPAAAQPAAPVAPAAPTDATG
jgi:hypothetical protein